MSQISLYIIEKERVKRKDFGLEKQGLEMRENFQSQEPQQIKI